jgi:hypothetical protein
LTSGLGSGYEEVAVNEYGAMARDHWRQWLPWRYAAAGDPDAFFAALGEEAAAGIAGLCGQMMAQAGNPRGEGYLERAGRLNAMRKQAEEIVLAEMVLLPPELGVPAQGQRQP